MNEPFRRALEYVRNTSGRVTKANFVDDYDPIGSAVWNDLAAIGLVEERNGMIWLTEAGKELLSK